MRALLVAAGPTLFLPNTSPTEFPLSSHHQHKAQNTTSTRQQQHKWFSGVAPCAPHTCAPALAVTSTAAWHSRVFLSGFSVCNQPGWPSQHAPVIHAWYQSLWNAHVHSPDPPMQGHATHCNGQATSMSGAMPWHPPGLSLSHLCLLVGVLVSSCLGGQQMLVPRVGCLNCLGLLTVCRHGHTCSTGVQYSRRKGGQGPGLEAHGR